MTKKKQTTKSTQEKLYFTSLIIFLKKNWYLVLLFFSAFVLALIPLITQTFFYYDQARDAYEAYSIWYGHHLKILGPGTDIPGLFHGVLWYYLLSIPYALGNNNPQLSTSLLFITLLLTIPVVGYFTHHLFQTRKITLLAMLLYVFTPLFQLSSRWLSNPVLGFFIMPFLLLSFWQYCTKKSYKWAIASGICFGILIQADFAYALLLLLIPVYVIVFRLYQKILPLILFIASLFLLCSSYIIAEIKFKGQGITGTLQFINAPHDSYLSLSRFLISFFDKCAQLVEYSVFPFAKSLLILVILCLIILVIIKRKKVQLTQQLLFLLLWLGNILLFQVFNTGISRSLFVFYPSLVAFVILFSFILVKLIPQRFVLAGIVLLLIIGQTWKSYGFIRQVQNPLTVQKGMTLPLEKQVIDYTYLSSGDKPFTINTITSPLYINTTWAYLYNFYAEPKYGYLPFWDGKDQVGRLGSLPEKSFTTEYRYLIIEPTTGIPDFFITQTILEENRISRVVEEKRIGNFRIQKRLSKMQEKFASIKQGDAK